ncbi:MAG: Uncharacterized protein K0Q74_521 [Gammaproteobacteria bacterium]|nr:Uncharacterized protein [Gammaproteobacteria bacterium]
MLKIHIALLLASVLTAPSIFADDLGLGMSPRDPKSCDAVAKACVKAGFLKTPSQAKHFWDKCMWPTILGKPVKNVTVDAEKIKLCRADKIETFKKELKELEEVAATEKED